MVENDLLQLQRLGIDIWVSPQRARELIAIGHACSLIENEATKSAQSSTVRSSSPRSWGRRVSDESTEAKYHEQAQTRDRRRAKPRETAATQDHGVGKTPPKPFAVQLRIFLYGSVAMLIEYSSQCPDLLTRDILRALSGFEEHHLNEFHFSFPFVAPSKSKSTKATLAGAQEGFQAWLEQRAPRCESMLVIGMPAKDTAARLIEKISRTIYIDELPLSRAGKQQLWNQIKNLNV